MPSMWSFSYSILIKNLGEIVKGMTNAVERVKQK